MLLNEGITEESVCRTGVCAKCVLWCVVLNILVIVIVGRGVCVGQGCVQNVYCGVWCSIYWVLSLWAGGVCRTRCVCACMRACVRVCDLFAAGVLRECSIVQGTLQWDYSLY